MSATSNRVIRGLAGVGPLLFFAIATIEGFVRAGYDPIAQPISALALGERGWIQGINFLILTLSLLALAAVLRAELHGGFASRIAPAVFVIMSIAVAVAGIFPMDAPGLSPTPSGELHMAAGFLVFPVIPLVVLLVALGFRRDARWRSHFGYSVVTALFCLASILVFLIFVGPPGFPRPYPGLVGLVQRVELFAFFTWIAFVVHHASPSATRSAERRGRLPA